MNGAASPPLVVGNVSGARTTQQPVMDAYQRKLGPYYIIASRGAHKALGRQGGHNASSDGDRSRHCFRHIVVLGFNLDRDDASQWYGDHQLHRYDLHVVWHCVRNSGPLDQDVQ